MLKAKRKNFTWGEIDMENLNINKLIIHFAQSNKVEGKSPQTIAWYSAMLTDFSRFLESVNHDTVLGEFTIAAIREFIVHEQDRGLSPYTVQGKVRTLKAFSSWLAREGYITENLLANLKLPGVPATLIEPLTGDEIDRLLGLRNPLTAMGSRDIAILLLLLDTGVRVGELCGVKMENTHIEEGYVKVMGKGNKERIVPVGASAQKALWRYTIHFRPDPSTAIDNPLFLTLDGERLRRNAVEQLIERWGEKASIPRLHPHLCRHTFATNYLIYNCGDVFRLQLILGHTSLEMVRRYVHFASSQALITGKVLSPIDQMGLNKLKSSKIDHLLNRKGILQAGQKKRRMLN